MAGLQGKSIKVKAEREVLRESREPSLRGTGDCGSINKREMGESKSLVVDEKVPEVRVWADYYKGKLLEVRVFDTTSGASG